MAGIYFVSEMPDVNVGAGLHIRNLVLYGVAGRKNQHWHGRVLPPDSAQHFTAIHAGQHEVKKYKVVLVRLRELQSASTILGNINCISFGDQASLDEAC